VSRLSTPAATMNSEFPRLNKRLAAHQSQGATSALCLNISSASSRS
jgi:hypothetical protein